MTKHSHEKAVDSQTFDRLYEAAGELAPPFDAECTFILIAGGRLGMRAGEICHIRESWVNWEKNMIEIPSFDPCDKGIDGGPCHYCQDMASQSAEHTGRDFDVVLEERWNPKTSNSARAIPFDFSERVQATVEAFFDRFGRYEHSRASVNRRVDRVCEAAGLPTSTCYPHSLRATAATKHAYSGLPVSALQSLFGWSSISTAQKYLRLSGGATAKALDDVYSD